MGSSFLLRDDRKRCSQPASLHLPAAARPWQMSHDAQAQQIVSLFGRICSSFLTFVY